MPYHQNKFRRLNIYILKLFGVWPKENHFNCSLYSTYGICIQTFFVKLHAFFAIVKLFAIYDNLAEFSSAIFITFSVLMTAVKFYFMMYKLSTIKNMVQKTTSDTFQPTTASQRQIFDKNLRSWNVMYILYMFVAYFTVFLWTLYPLMDNKERRLPFNVWYPYDYRMSPLYELSYLHQIIMIMVVVSVSLNVDTLTSAMMMHIALQCEIISDTVRNIYDYTRNRLETEGKSALTMGSQEVNKSLVMCINHHREILMQVY